MNTKDIGEIGENIACKYLENKGFLLIDRNYYKKWGEIDIVTAKDKIIHFIEVKSIVLKGDMGYRPEENVHILKQKRLKRTIQTYLLEKKYNIEAEFKFHIVIVHMNPNTRRANVTFMENIIL